MIRKSRLRATSAAINGSYIHEYEVRIKLLQEAVNDLEKRLLDE